MDKTIGILNFHFAKNYGAVMVPWAMQYILKHEFEQSSKVINYTFPTSQTDKYQYNSFDRFREDFLDITAYHCEITDSLYKYSDTFHTIIVGSDQVFRTSPEQPYYLKWVYGDVRCIAYAQVLESIDLRGTCFLDAKPRNCSPVLMLFLYVNLVE